MNTAEKVLDLERRGYRVTIAHLSLRSFDDLARVARDEVAHEVYRTQVQVRPRGDDAGWVLLAEARCHPRDVFDAMIGAEIAVGRAYKALTPPLTWADAGQAPMSVRPSVMRRGYPEDTAP